ncbi:hypothetical protein [Petrachloros mirabilis]
MSALFENRLRLHAFVQRGFRFLCLLFIGGVVTVGLGCATEEVLLRHPETHEVVKCGPFATPTAADRVAAVKRTRECVEDYERKGYKRLL